MFYLLITQPHHKGSAFKVIIANTFPQPIAYHLHREPFIVGPFDWGIQSWLFFSVMTEVYSSGEKSAVVMTVALGK